jgi:hypothetical protein
VRSRCETAPAAGSRSSVISLLRDLHLACGPTPLGVIFTIALTALQLTGLLEVLHPALLNLSRERRPRLRKGCDVSQPERRLAWDRAGTELLATVPFRVAQLSKE